MSNPELSFSEEEFLTDISSIRQSSIISHEKQDYQMLIQTKEKSIKNLQQINNILSQKTQSQQNTIKNLQDIIWGLKSKCVLMENEIQNKNLELAKLKAKLDELVSLNIGLGQKNLQLQSVCKSKEESAIQSLSMELQEEKKISARLNKKVKELEVKVEELNISLFKETQMSNDLKRKLSNKLERLAQEMNTLKKNYEEEINKRQKQIAQSHKFSIMKSQNHLFDCDQTEQDHNANCTQSHQIIIMRLEEQLKILNRLQKISFLNMVSTWAEQKIESNFQAMAIL